MRRQTTTLNRRNFVKATAWAGGVGMAMSDRPFLFGSERGPRKGREVKAKTGWISALELNQGRKIIKGSGKALSEAISRGADLRISTEFRNNEHIDPDSDNPELIQEMAEFRVTFLLEGQWSAGIMTLRQPISLPDGFGPRPSMSFFMYNQNGLQGIARPFLDGGQTTGELGPSPVDDRSNMPKYHQMDSWDARTNAPSHNFIFDFDMFRYLVRDDWQEVLAHDEKGKRILGSIEQLVEAFWEGYEIKVGIQGICGDLEENSRKKVQHELFIHLGYSYYYTKSRLFIGATHPVVRVRPAIPMRYASRGWDFGWLMPRTDGFVALLLYDPYTLNYRRTEGHYPIRWFARKSV